MIRIDKYAYMSNLRESSPVQKTVLAALMTGICLWADSMSVSFAILLSMSLITVKKGGIPMKSYIGLMMLPLSFLLIGTLTIAFEISTYEPGANHVIQHGIIFSRNIGILSVSVSKFGVLRASSLYIKALGATSCLYFLSLSTPMTDIMSVLRKLRLPSLLIDLMLLIYRFIFVLLEVSNTIFTAQESRMGYSSIANSYRSLGSLASSLFIRSYVRSDAVYTALEARGYDGEITVIEREYEDNPYIYAGMIVVSITLIAATLVLKSKFPDTILGGSI
jgi:cobalt/nickel transport system permease protein